MKLSIDIHTLWVYYIITNHTLSVMFTQKGGEQMRKKRFHNVIYRNIVIEMITRGECYDELADICGVYRQAFTKKMRGDTHFTVPQAHALCVHFNKPFEYLFETEF